MKDGDLPLEHFYDLFLNRKMRAEDEKLSEPFSGHFLDFSGSEREMIDRHART